jgi:hypothetical protein
MASMKRNIIAPLSVVLAFAFPASATTLRVPSEYTTINAALDATSPGDTVLVAPGRYTEAETRVIDIGGAGPLTATCLAFLADGVTLLSEGGPAVTTLDMSESIRVGRGWAVVGGLLPSGVTVEGFTITGTDNDTASHFQNNGTCRVLNCWFLDIDAPSATGGGVTSTKCRMEIVGCRFENCLAGLGGAAAHGDGDFAMEDSHVLDCTAAAGGGLYVAGGPQFPFHMFEVRDCVFAGNRALGGAGGAIAQAGDNHRSGRVVSGCWFVDNEAANGSGGISVGDDSPVTVEGCVFIRNRVVAALGRGGGGSVYGEPATVRNNTFHGNSQVSDLGGASLRLVGTCTLENNVFTSSDGSSAVYVFNGTVDPSCNVYWDNALGNTLDFEMGPTDRIVDPLYCDPDHDDLTVSSLSPCLPANSLGCGLIGAFGEGCGTVSVEPTTWGQIKARFR